MYCGSLMTPIGIQTAQLFIRLTCTKTQNPQQFAIRITIRDSSEEFLGVACQHSFHSRLFPFALISNKCLKMLVYNTSCFTMTSNEDACSQYSSSAYRSFPTPRDLEQPLSLCSQICISIYVPTMLGRFCRVDENKYGSLGMKV